MAEHRLARVGVALVAALLILSRAPGHAMADPMAGSAPGGQFHVREPLAAHVPDPLKVTVEVSYKGLNHRPGLEIEAVLGQEVEITFVWADVAVPDNTHRLLLRGYDLTTGLLDAENREQTLRFMADRVGTFELVCDWRCEGHADALQSARLTVLDPHPATQPSLVPTRLRLAPAPAVDRSALTLSATLTESSGDPVAGAPVAFFLRSTLAGVDGEAEVATALTDERGTAMATYRPTVVGEHLFVIRFPGSDLLDGSEELLAITVDAVAEPYRVPPRGLDPISDLAPLVIVVVVGGVWATFGYVLLQVVGIRRSRPAPAAPGEPSAQHASREEWSR